MVKKGAGEKQLVHFLLMQLAPILLVLPPSLSSPLVESTCCSGNHLDCVTLHCTPTTNICHHLYLSPPQQKGCLLAGRARSFFFSLTFFTQNQSKSLFGILITATTKSKCGNFDCSKPPFGKNLKPSDILYMVVFAGLFFD